MATYKPALVRALLVVLVVSTLGSCADAPTAPPAAVVPLMGAPTDLVPMISWSVANRRPTEFVNTLSEGFRFEFVGSDSSGVSRDSSWTRAEFLQAWTTMLVGRADHPAAETVRLDTDLSLTDLPDPRPGRDPRFHRVVRSSIDMRLSPGDGYLYEAVTLLEFRVTRGDSVSIPADLRARGVGPDSTLWWLDAIEELPRESAARAPRGVRIPGFVDLLRPYR